MAETIVRVEEAPGWLRHSEPTETGKSNRIWYTSPTGEVVSKTAFQNMRRAGTFPASEPSYAAPEIVDPAAVEWTPAPLPEPEPRPLTTGRDRPSDHRATSEQISESLLYVVILGSAIAAFFLRADELQMSEEEAADLAVPLANILSGSRLNRQYGHYLRDLGDYTRLGYALGSYGLRVATMLRERNERTPHASTAQSVTAAQYPTGVTAPGDQQGGEPGSARPVVTHQAPSGAWYSPIPGTRPTGAGLNGSATPRGSDGYIAPDAGTVQR